MSMRPTRFAGFFSSPARSPNAALISFTVIPPLNASASRAQQPRRTHVAVQAGILQRCAAAHALCVLHAEVHVHLRLQQPLHLRVVALLRGAHELGAVARRHRAEQRARRAPTSQPAIGDGRREQNSVAPLFGLFTRSDTRPGRASAFAGTLSTPPHPTLPPAQFSPAPNRRARSSVPRWPPAPRSTPSATARARCTS